MTTKIPTIDQKPEIPLNMQAWLARNGCQVVTERFLREAIATSDERDRLRAKLGEELGLGALNAR